MLLSITNSCHMGCMHCMDDAKPCEEHMNFKTFIDAVSFFNQMGGIELVITGGEPTDNPEWMHMLKYALDTAHGSSGAGYAHITLTTNGMTIANNKDIQVYLLTLFEKYTGKLTVQVTHVDEYYPQVVNLDQKFFDLAPHVVVCKKIEAMYPMGRARKNNLPWSSKCSKCFNIRSAVRHFDSLATATLTLALKEKFCTPQVDIYGNIKLGESCLCPVVSNIYNSTEKIIKDIKNFKCSGCDIINKNLPKEYLMAIGEYEG